MSTPSESSKDDFLVAVRMSRQERAKEKQRETCVVVVQSCVRRWLTMRKIYSDGIKHFDGVMGNPEGEILLRPAVEVYRAAKILLYICKKNMDNSRLEYLCKHILRSLDSSAKNFSYVGLVLTKEHAVPWVAHIKKLLKCCCKAMEPLRPEFSVEARSLSVYLHMLISFTSIGTWAVITHAQNEVLSAGMKIICNTIVDFLIAEGLFLTLKEVLHRGLCRSVCLKKTCLSAVLRLSIRPLIKDDFSDEVMTMFVINILSTPGLIHHLEHLSPESFTTLSKHLILERTLNFFAVEQNLRIVFNALEGSYALSLLGNIIQMAHMESDPIIHEIVYPALTFVLKGFLESCLHYVESKQSNLTHWHPILGWFSQKVDPELQQTVPRTKAQLLLLGNAPLINAFVGYPLEDVALNLPPQLPPVEVSSSQSVFSTLLQKVTEKRLNHPSVLPQPSVRMDSEECIRISRACAVYQTALDTLTQIRLDILTGFSFQDKVLHNLWKLIAGIGCKQFLDHFAACNRVYTPELQMLTLFADSATHFLSILDDVEMYEKQKPFKLYELVAMSGFLNVFLYKGVSQKLFDFSEESRLTSTQLFHSLHSLFMVLFKRDCRRRFTPDNHWLIKEIRISSFLSDLEKGKKPAMTLLHTMPHILPQCERVRYFRKLIDAEKESSGLVESSTIFPQRIHITVHRSRIVEDGYRQLGALPPLALKGVVRVHFINEQGLNEAGIDQDGVFKEFLEETIKRVFDPGLNLFRVTSEQRLYPSPTSHLVEDHLKLFEFVGRMLGKAVYEGIVVDVPFALFFLSQVLGLGQPQQALHSSMDELPSLDPELYQSLTFIKHTRTDVSHLALTFSADCDHLGQVITQELIPGGKAIPVTNQNKINYIHLMAHFRMHTQIKDQTAAFIRGFRSIINPDWLAMFSAPELQRLISGDNVPIDMKSLRKYTQYYGGFHDSHRVIVWLWDILERDFNEQEKSLFLKFVTSCSKPPLLGFSHLEPPFSIRCVEVSDDDDQGDTVGSVMRGFFTIRKKDPLIRLPTSSTCFNLLKLPNYQKKSTLKEKLRYAISCNPGFELS